MVLNGTTGVLKPTAGVLVTFIESLSVFFFFFFFRNEPDDPFSIGRGDLDPFGGGLGRGGGMFFDPMRGGRGPRFGMDPSAGLPSSLPP